MLFLGEGTALRLREHFLERLERPHTSALTPWLFSLMPVPRPLSVPLRTLMGSAPGFNPLQGKYTSEAEGAWHKVAKVLKFQSLTGQMYF